MRVLLALDGSPSSDAACELVGSLAWPEGSVIEVIGVVEPVAEVLAPLVVSAPVVTPLERQTSHELKRLLDQAVASLEKPTLAVRRRILVGRPGTRIVDAATDTRAELVVVGSRGRGPLTSMLLGSVSAEVVDHAPCPVLVVRGPIAGSILVAVDGSPSAQAAVTYLSANRIFAAYPVEVMCVAPGNDLPGVYSAVGISDLAADSFARRLGENRERAEAVAAGAAQRLGAGGYRARWSVSMGNAAHEIIEAAKSFGSGLVVMGSRGHTGLARIVLGSVARNVLLHSSTSVLIVREPIRAPSAEPVGRIDGRPVAQATAAGAC
jgi:nucleotide-binding universal stress UspA family protein